MFQSLKNLSTLRKSCLRRNFWIYVWLTLVSSIWTHHWPDNEVEGCDQRSEPVPLYHAYWDKEWRVKHEHLSINEQREIAREQYVNGELDYIYDMIPGGDPRK